MQKVFLSVSKGTPFIVWIMIKRETELQLLPACNTRLQTVLL